MNDTNVTEKLTEEMYEVINYLAKYPIVWKLDDREVIMSIDTERSSIHGIKTVDATLITDMVKMGLVFPKFDVSGSGVAALDFELTFKGAEVFEQQFPCYLAAKRLGLGQ